MVPRTRESRGTTGFTLFRRRAVTPVGRTRTTKADGTGVAVKFDKDVNVLRVEQGMGKGDQRPAV